MYKNEAARELAIKLREKREIVEQLKRNTIKEENNGYDSIEYIRPLIGDIIVAYYNMEELEHDIVRDMHEFLTKVFPKNNVVSLPDVYTIQACDKPEFARIVFSILEHIFNGHREYIDLLRNELDRIDGDDLK